ncbi:hypothetical protein S40288_10868 [Stachybotrys chartarum IBT 40288]|nr:hypothetical protein S40288_10868 [Stachybotrys chartarum IBT 40288]
MSDIGRTGQDTAQIGDTMLGRSRSRMADRTPSPLPALSPECRGSLPVCDDSSYDVENPARRQLAPVRYDEVEIELLVSGVNTGDVTPRTTRRHSDALAAELVELERGPRHRKGTNKRPMGLLKSRRRASQASKRIAASKPTNESFIVAKSGLVVSESGVEVRTIQNESNAPPVSVGERWNICFMGRGSLA